ncbi:MAG: OmpA family protein [Sulfurimonas sp.]|uniref:OmpA family protein n=1 Tax=Sulfurimonas sp. TaxID=2022749 RepID=UPI00260253AF|nr:OmpA family protein [Sulfurimonas sp.]MDD2651707.1 OmpA family protein [Sulfurimonas sp.]MDD3451741.1 OmpA family protein [Sulfurimonas sp.]
MHYFILTILLLSSLFAKTVPFSLIIDKPFENALFDVTEDYDRSISAVGFIRPYKNSTAKNDGVYTNAFDYLASVSNTHGAALHLVKVDADAEISFEKTLGLLQFTKGVGIVKTPQNGYIVGGNTMDGSLIVAKLDANANLLFHKTFGTPKQDTMSKILLLRDGGVLVIGSSTTAKTSTNNLFQSGLGLSDIYVARFSSNGEMLWSKKYGTSYDDSGVDAQEAEDGSIMLLGQTSGEKSKYPTLLRITEEGEKIWLREIKGQSRSSAYKIAKLRDNNFILSLSHLNDMGKEQIRLIKVDLHQNILVDKTIQTTYASVLYDIQESQDGKLFGVGKVVDGYNTDALAMLLDGKLAMINQEHYGSDTYDAFHALTILHNSQIAAVGVHTNTPSQESDMWVVKLGQDLKMVKVSKKDVTQAAAVPSSSDLYAQLQQLFKEEIDAKKIALHKDLGIDFIDKSLYFNLGEFVLTAKQKEFLQKFGAKLIPFLEKNKQLITTLEVSGHTSSEWGTTDFSQRYLNNADLSMKRSFSTMSYLFGLQNQERQKWLSEILKGSGLSFSKKVTTKEGEDKEKSRRVSFKILLR